MKGDLQELLHKKMTRQEFLRYVGGAVLVLFGFSNLISYLSRPAKSAVQSPSDSQHGFGSRKFGG